MGAAGTVTPDTGATGDLPVVDFGIAPEDEKAPVSTGGADDTNAGAAKETPPATPEADPDRDAAVALLGQEQYDKLKDNPKALAKGLHQSYTKKMQGLSGYADFIRAFESDPEATLRDMAKQVGGEFTKKQATKENITEGVRTQLAEVIGSEAADALLPLLEKVVDAKVQPTLDRIAALDRESALHAADTLIDRFKSKYPDYEKFAPRMEKLGLEMLPGKNADEFEYMERLYKLAKADTGAADTAQEAVTRMTASARSAEKPASGVPHTRVAALPTGKKITFEEAWAAARRGEAWDPAEVRAARRGSKS